MSLNPSRKPEPGPASGPDEYAFPLSFSQQRLWFIDHWEPGNPAYIVPDVLRLRGRLDVEALARALGEIVARHETLRTTFRFVDGAPVQVVSPTAPVLLQPEEVPGRDASEREQAARALVNDEAMKPFDLSRGPVFRFRLLGLGPEDHLLTLTFHHIAFDGWSFGVLVRELSALYAAFLEGRPSPLPELPLQYADYTLWQRDWLQGSVLQDQLEYWRRQLSGVAPLELPTDRPRPADRSFQGGRHSFVIDREVSARLRALSREWGATLFMPLLAAFQALLARYSGQADIAVGTPIAGRTRAETENLIGFFVNTLVLRTDLSGDPTFRELVERTRGVCLGAYAHQDLPFEKLVEELQPQRDLSRPPLFQVMFALQSGGENREFSLPGLRVQGFPPESPTAKVDLTVSMVDTPEGLLGWMEYSTDLFDESTIVRLVGHFQRLLSAATREPEARLSALPMMSAAERDQALVQWNRTQRAYPRDRTVHELFQAQARRTPDAAAVAFGSTSLTYAQLDDRSNQLAHLLRANGAGPEAFVGLGLERSLDFVVAALAVLKAGAAYVPLDPAYPAERLALMLQDTQAVALVTQSQLRARLPAHPNSICLDTDWASRIAGQPTQAPPNSTPASGLAYVIYTSGSTGTPKGVAVTHEAIGRLAYDTEYIKLGPGDRVAHASNVSFDAATFELWSTLLHGATIVGVDQDVLLAPRRFAAQLQTDRINVAFVTTALFNQFARETPDLFRGMSYVLFGGEAVDPRRVAEVLAKGPPRNLLHVYGPTETTTFATWFRVESVPAGATTLPIGRPLANTSLYVLDAAGNPVPVGVPGELCIGGPGVARGYLNRPELTAERFLPDPFSPEPGARMYRTGDLVRWLPDGVVEFVGRADHQVKIRGFRVELGEIESALVRFPGVRDAIVLARAETAGPKRLVAYVVAADGAQLAPQDLRAHAKRTLPDYMVPSAFVLLPALPLTPNGKVDRAALPAPPLERADLAAAYVPPRTPVERTLCDIWADVLRVSRVGVHDNFFDLGGDSILSIQLLARANQAGLGLTTKQIFQHQTIAELGPFVVQERPVDQTADQNLVTGAVPLTPIQRWFFERAPRESQHFNQSLLLSVPKDLDVQFLQDALDHVLRHHDALRLRFVQAGNGWNQQLSPEVPAVPLENLDPALAESTLTEFQAGFDLAHGPLLRAALLQTKEGPRLLLVAHHLAVDAVSWNMIVEDLSAAYEQLRSAQAVRLAPKTTSFKAWAERLVELAQTEDVQSEHAYWQELARGAPADLPFDHVGGANTVASGRDIAVELSEAETRLLLQEVPKAYRTQINDALLTALCNAITSWTGRDDCYIQLEGHGREDVGPGFDVSRTVGWFTSMFPVRLRMPATRGPGDVLRCVKEQLRSLPRRGLGYGLLRYLSGPGRERVIAPNPSISFNYLGQFSPGTSGPDGFRPVAGSKGLEYGAAAERAAALEVNGLVSEGRLRFWFAYSENLHRRATIESVARGFLQSLRDLIAHCSDPTAGGCTPSDFPLARLDQSTLDRVVGADRSIVGVYPASPLQEGLLFHSLYDPQSRLYFEQFGFRLEGPLDLESLCEAWRTVVARHAVLRTGFSWQAGSRPLQVVRGSVDPPLERLDWSHVADGQREPRLRELLAGDRRRGFDLTKPPLMRLHLIQFGKNLHHLVWSFHHALLDGWSNNLVLSEVFGLYETLRTKGRPTLPPAQPFADYLAWLDRQDRGAAERYWRRTLEGIEAPTPLAFDGGPDESPQHEEPPGQTVLQLSEDATGRIHELARSLRVTANTVVQGAWALLLARYSGQDDVLFGTTVSGRPADLAGVESVVGLFINTLPARVRTPPTQAVGAWLQELQRQQVEMRQFEHTPLGDIQRWGPLGAGQPLFHSLFVFENFPIDRSQKPPKDGLRIHETAGATRTNYPLMLTAGGERRLVVKLTYDRARFEEPDVNRIMGHLEAALAALCDGPHAPLADVSIWTDQERRQVLEEWTRTQGDFPHDKSLVDLFEATVERSPEAPAVAFGDRVLTFRQLNSLANRLAHQLRGLGVGPDLPVALLLERGADLLVAVLGILKAGGAYVPLDPAYPRERLELMVSDSQAVAVVTQEALAARLSGIPCPTLLVAHAVAPGNAPDTNPARTVQPNNLAYVIYTSGTTGTPKGVMVEHRSVLNLLTSLERRIHAPIAQRLGRRLRFSLNAPLAFDSSVKQWISLLNGHTVCVVDESERHDASALQAFLRRHRVDVLDCTPSQLRMLGFPTAWRPEEAPAACLVGGEAIDAPLWRRLATDGRTQFFNVYGPTECTVDATVAPIRPGTRPNLGHPVDNARLYVLDAAGLPVPAGVPGELHIGGDVVARGYLRRPELTAERFLPDHLSPVPGARRYRTGDRVRWRSDGSLEFLGRVDHQVKIRGHRVELGEVESVLAACEGVREAAVVARSDGTGHLRLVAYVVHAEPAAPPAAQWRDRLKRSLPDYMVPSAFVVLDRLPLTPNGKLDRRALPAPPTDRPNLGHEYVPPHGPAEQTLARIWSDVLKVDRVGAQDNFFDLGGDSILSIQIVARASEAGLHLTPRQVFEHPTVAALASVASTDSLSAEDQEPEPGPVPLTPIQRRFFSRPGDRPHHYNMSLVLQAPPDLDEAALQAALDAIVAHHDALRMRFVRGDDGWRQVLAAQAPVVRIHRVNEAVGDADARAAGIQEQLTRIQESLDLAAGPLFCAAVVAAVHPTQLVLIAHHLVVDAVSWNILAQDLETAYAQAARGEPIRLPRRTASYKGWAERLLEIASSDALQGEIDFWRQQAEPAPAPLPVDQVDGENTWDSTRTVTVELPEAETRALLQEVPKAYRTRANDALLAALAQVLSSRSESRDCLIEMEGHGREDVGAEIDVSRTVGWFTSVFPVRLTLPEADDPGIVLRSVKEQLRRLPRRGFGFGLLKYLAGEAVRGNLASSNGPQVAFNYLGQFEPGESGGGAFRPGDGPRGLEFHPAGARSHLLAINGMVSDGRLRFWFTYSKNLHRRTTIESMANSYLAALRRLIEHCTRPGAGGCTPSDFPLARLDQQTLDRLVGRGEDVANVYPLSPLQQGLLFHSLYEPHTGAYFEQQRFRLEGDLDVDALIQAWTIAAKRHSVLRSSFVWEGVPQPLQIEWARADLSVQCLDWRSLDQVEQERRLEAFVRDDRRRGFDLGRAPLARVTLVRRSDRLHELVWSFHHILLDGWSNGIVVAEVFSLYESLRSGGRPNLAPARPFADYVAWLQRQDQGAPEAYWRRTLHGFASPTSLGIDRPGAASSPDADPGQVVFRLPEAATRRLQELARSLRVTLNTVVQGAWALLLSRYSGERDVVFGATVSGRPPDMAGVEARVGLFINTLAVRVDVAPDQRVADWLQVLQQRQLELRQFEHTPLADVQRWSSIGRGRRLFDSLFVFESYPTAAGSNEGSSNLVVKQAQTFLKTNYPLMIVVEPGRELQFKVFYEIARFEPGAIERLLLHLQTILEGMSAKSAGSLSQLGLVTSSERDQVLTKWNSPDRHFPVDGTVHQLFEAQVRRAPASVALAFQGRSLTYSELNARANRLAHFLRTQGVGPEALVGLYLERSLDLVVAILGVLKAGGAYVPLDAAYPSDRLAFMLEDAGARLILTQDRMKDRLPHGGVRIVSLDGDAPAYEGYPETDPAPAAGPENLAYVIYTSGSTGRPKGVMIPHGRVVRLLAATNEWFGFSETDVWTLFHSYAFDFSVWELWGALAYGGRLVVVPFEVSRDPAAFHGLLVEQGVTVLNQTPSAFRQLIQADEQAAPEGRLRLRYVVFGGEALETTSLKPWFDRHGDQQPRLINMYGITETTVHVTYRPIRREDAERAQASPIGAPIPDLQMYVLDPYGNLLPPGVTGELFVGGAGLARGYLNRPELTRERFVPDPFAAQAGRRLYRTGDLARFRPDGNLEYLGRIDHQVKIRGFRIELGEIEAGILSHPGVREVVVIARPAPAGENRLVAYLVPAGDPPPGVGQLRDHLKRFLPDYMVPAAFVSLPSIPLTPNGKVDRQALPAPDGDRPDLANAFVAPRTPLEQALADAWCQVLGVARVGVHDNFFDLGGDSILSIKVVARAREAGIALTPRDVFERQSVAELAAAVATEDGSKPSAPATDAAPAAAILAASSRPGSGSVNPADFPLARLDQRTLEKVLKKLERKP